jgi:hypothetical protein
MPHRTLRQPSDDLARLHAVDVDALAQRTAAAIAAARAAGDADRADALASRLHGLRILEEMRQ